MNIMTSKNSFVSAVEKQNLVVKIAIGINPISDPFNGALKRLPPKANS
jgi:hypothetical protein